MSTPDDELMDRLRRIAGEVDPTPGLVDEAARAAFLTRRLDAELAELISDTELAEAGVRGEGPRVLAYEQGDVTLELQLESGPGGLLVSGLVSGAQAPVHVRVDTPATTVDVDTDDAGWFSVDGVATGPVRVRVSSAGKADVTTGWIQA